MKPSDLEHLATKGEAQRHRDEMQIRRTQRKQQRRSDRKDTRIARADRRREPFVKLSERNGAVMKRLGDHRLAHLYLSDLSPWVILKLANEQSVDGVAVRTTVDCTDRRHSQPYSPRATLTYNAVTVEQVKDAQENKGLRHLGKLGLDAGVEVTFGQGRAMRSEWDDVMMAARPDILYEADYLVCSRVINPIGAVRRFFAVRRIETHVQALESSMAMIDEAIADPTRNPHLQPVATAVTAT